MNRILFVDDEPLVLEGLRNSLRGKRREWEMLFQHDAATALADLERAPVDVIVTDMRMPGMDGADFLARAIKVCPGATRIILSGQMEEASLARAAITAHRYLTKPCKNTVLLGSITQALELQALMHNERVRASIGAIESLPTVPGVYQALTTALANDRSSPEAIAAIVEEDVAISSKVLHIVNSAFFGLPRKTTSLLQAVRYLGLGTIRSLVLSHSVFEQFGRALPGLAELGHDHALECAHTARQLLGNQPAAEVAFTAGLLHDIGSLVFASRIPEEYTVICREAQRAGVAVHHLERERLGVTHAEAGAYLLGLWDLPHEVIDVVAGHHTPWTPGAPLDASAAIRLADVICLEADGDAATVRCHADELPPDWRAQPGVESALESARARGRS